ncbi:MAG: acetate kinase [Acidobacteria bacterium]|nr:acetate kinase [Acidobacteriota bacterium]
MKVLVLNCGSSSVKFQLIETDLEAIKTNSDICLAKGRIERVGKEDAKIVYEVPEREKYKTVLPILNHAAAIKETTELLTGELGVIGDLKEIEAVGHRTVHGGEDFSDSTVWNDAVLKTVEECSKLAPLHNPHNITGYLEAKKVFPDVPHVAVFDTAFHQTMKPVAYLYGLPYEYYRKYKIRRYGFHGTSHRYVSYRAAQLLGKDLSDLKIITNHLGNGSSVAAIDKGQSVDTSMGYTPLEGLVMGTRCGDIDPSIPLSIIKSEGISAEEMDTFLNKKCGLLGISELSNDMLDLENAYYEGNEQAELAMRIFCYRIKKYIGAYSAAMNGVDVIIFTGGIGENSNEVREWSTEGLDFMGALIDIEKNKELNRGEGIISKPESKVKIMLIPTNEELLIARDTVRLISA